MARRWACISLDPTGRPHRGARLCRVIAAQRSPRLTSDSENRPSARAVTYPRPLQATGGGGQKSAGHRHPEPAMYARGDFFPAMNFGRCEPALSPSREDVSAFRYYGKACDRFCLRLLLLRRFSRLSIGRHRLGGQVVLGVSPPRARIGRSARNSSVSMRAARFYRSRFACWPRLRSLRRRFRSAAAGGFLAAGLPAIVGIGPAP